jgi:hypothetical protein
MKNPIIWVVIAILLILIGTGLLTYSGVCVTVEKNGKKRSVVHGVYIAMGVILIIISIIIFWLIASDYRNLRKQFNAFGKIEPGYSLIPLPSKFGRWVSVNMKVDEKFTKILGNYMDAGGFKALKGFKTSDYKFYGSIPDTVESKGE